MRHELHEMTGLRRPPLTLADVQAIPALSGLVVFAAPRTRMALLMRLGVLPGGRDREAIATAIGCRPASVYPLLRDLTARYDRCMKHHRAHGRAIEAPDAEHVGRRVHELRDGGWRNADRRTSGEGGMRRLVDPDAP